MRFFSRCGLAALGVLLVASACSSFQSTSTSSDRPDATVSDGSPAPVLDAAEPEDSAPPVDGAAATPDATTVPDADVDAGAPCTVTCRSHQCDDDGGCHPLAFVTLEVFDGAILVGDAGTGLARADAFCNQLADGGSFLALLSTPDVDAVTRFAGGSGAKRPVREYDSTVIAPSLDSMFAADGGLIADFDETVTGKPIPDGRHVWTGTTLKGAMSQRDCASWSSAMPQDMGTYGQIGGLLNIWLEASVEGCNLVQGNHLYCLETVP